MAISHKTGSPARGRRGYGWVWAVSITFSAAWLATSWLRNPTYGTAAAVAATIPYAAWANRAWSGMARGALTGLAGTLGIVSAWLGFDWWVGGPAAAQLAAIAALTTLAACIAAGWVFAHMSGTRRSGRAGGPS